MLVVEELMKHSFIGQSIELIRQAGLQAPPNICP